MSDNEYQEIYTDAPKKWDNLFFGCFQLLYWMFFKPSAWRNYIKTDNIQNAIPNLEFDFCLSQLTWRQWHESGLWRVFVQGYFILPLLAIFLIWVFLTLFGDNTVINPINMDFVIAGSLGFGLACGLALGIISSVVIGAISGTLFIFAGSFIFFQQKLDFANIILLCLVIGIVGNLIITISSEKLSTAHRIGGIIIGILAGIIGTVFLVVISLSVLENVDIAVAIATLTLISFIIITFSCPIKNWGYVAFGLFIVIYGAMAFNTLGFAGGLAKGIVYGTLLAASLTIPYIVVNRWLGSKNIIAAAGVIAGVLTVSIMGGILAGFLNSTSDEFVGDDIEYEIVVFFIIFGIVSAILGLSFSWWRGTILWPFLFVWHSLIYFLEKRRINKPSLLLYHAAFWDEHQQLNLLGLPEHILLIVEKNPPEAQQALKYLKNTHQKWAIKETKVTIDSPYLFGQHIDIKSNKFIGRTNIANELQELLFKQHSSVFLQGLYRIGKTSLLINLRSLLHEPDAVVALFIDLQGAASIGNNVREFLCYISEQMVNYAKKHYDLSLPLFDDQNDKPYRYFNKWLDKVQQQLDSKTLLLMFDEFAKLDDVIREKKSDYSEDILDTMRHWIQHRENFQIVITSQRMEEFNRWPSLANNMVPKHLGDLTNYEARQLIEHPVKDFQLKYESDAIQRILELTHCHPALIQLICREIVVLKNDQELDSRFLVVLQDVEDIIPQALETGQSIFVTFKQRATDAGNKLLRYMAKYGKGTVIDKKDLQHSSENVLETLENLELIEPVENGYRFRVEMFRLWYAMNKRL